MIRWRSDVEVAQFQRRETIKYSYWLAVRLSPATYYFKPIVGIVARKNPFQFFRETKNLSSNYRRSGSSYSLSDKNEPKSVTTE